MVDIAYYNGKYGRINEMYIPFNDRSHFFGDGVYEVALARNYKIYALYEHIDRLYSGAELLDINIQFSKDVMADILCSLSKKLNSPDQMVYWQVTRGTCPRSHTYEENLKANFWVMITPSKMRDVYQPIQAVTLPDTRWHHCNIKSLNLIPSVMYSQKAKSLGVYETILYRENGRVTECSHSNIHIITKDGVFKTAPADELVLSGISRSHLISACLQLGIKVDESPFTVDEMMNADEIFTSSTTAPIMVCNMVDGTAVGGKAHDSARKLREWIITDFISQTD